jgi:hypothetical protein
MTIEHVERLAKDLGGTIEEVGRLPDGSGFAMMSMPLPKDHWIYAKSPEGHSLNPPMTFRMPMSHPRYADFVARVREAAKYAVRSATLGGTEMDFDPDALLQNLIVGLTGYATDDALSHMDGDMWNPIPHPPLMDEALRPLGSTYPGQTNDESPEAAMLPEKSP